MKIIEIIMGLGLMLSVAIGVHAKEYHVTVPYGPGAGADVLARQLQTVFQRNTGQTLLVENKSGADGILGVLAWKSNPRSDIIIIGSNITVYANPFNTNNRHFSHDDFNHVIFTGTMPGFWITRPGTGIQSPKDLLTKMPRMVGGYVASYNLNLRPFQKQGLDVSIVDYKSANDVLIDVANGTLELGLVGPSPALWAMVKQNRLHVVGGSFDHEITVEGIKVASVSAMIGIDQFSVGNTIALKPGMDPARAEYLRQQLLIAFTDPETQAKLQNLGIRSDFLSDPEKIKSFFTKMRAKAQRYQ